MNIIDETRVRGGAPTEAELQLRSELIRRARERAALASPDAHLKHSVLARWGRLIQARATRRSAGEIRTS